MKVLVLIIVLIVLLSLLILLFVMVWLYYYINIVVVVLFGDKIVIYMFVKGFMIMFIVSWIENGCFLGNKVLKFFFDWGLFDKYLYNFVIWLGLMVVFN